MTNGTVECLHCHTPVPASSRYCSVCGADQTGGGGPATSAGAAALLIRLQHLVEGKYKIERMLGRGGMGTVYLAHDLTLEREVAIKVLFPDAAQDDQGVRRFQQEAKTAAKLDHPNIIPIYRVESEAGLNYFVMKYVSGTSLEDVLEQKQPLATDYTQRVLWEAACALGHAHTRGVVHRDVKPANIMFDHDGRVMLTDFGISKALQAATGFTATGMIIGTPHYMAPEQAKGASVDGRADQYSLGVVGYRMVTGELPFAGDSIHTVLYKQIFEHAPAAKSRRADIPNYLSAAISRAMSKDPDDRFATTEAFATAVWPEQPVVAAQPGRPGTRPTLRPRVSPDAPTEVSAAATTPLPAALVSPPPPPSPRPQLKKKSKVPLVVAGAAVAAAGLGGYLLLGRGTQASHEPPAARVDSLRVQDTVTVPAPSQQPPRVASPRTHEPVAAPPVAAQGYITVNAEPYGELYVDGVDLGPTPVVRYAVPAGVHTIKVVREGFKTVGEKVQVDAGNTVPKRYTLLPGG
jgi:eukaryotic-like serine/threonine-protein kinase